MTEENQLQADQVDADNQDQPATPNVTAEDNVETAEAHDDEDVAACLARATTDGSGLDEPGAHLDPEDFDGFADDDVEEDEL